MAAEMNAITGDELRCAEEQSQLPENPDCSDDAIPHGAEPEEKKETLILPDLVSMWKYMLSPAYANRRLSLYTFLNQLLRRGRLSEIVGFRVLNRVINREACELAGVTFWKVDRESFYADVQVRLTLRTAEGQREWQGILVCWCMFDDDDHFTMNIEKLVPGVDRTGEDLVLLSPFLVPYMTNQHMDAYSESLWAEYGLGEAVYQPKLRSATELARRMGLQIRYMEVYDHQAMDSILFFEDSDLLVGKDRLTSGPDGKIKRVMTPNPITVRIAAGTIVVNTNRVRQGYADFQIFHECIHDRLHYLFYRLQKLASNDVRLVRTVQVEAASVEESKRTDPLFFMENQADRGAIGLMMPASDMKDRLWEALVKVRDYRNAGDRYQQAGFDLAEQIERPTFRIKTRMVQLGHIEAKGALNYLGSGHWIKPFAFDRDSWRENEVTFVLTRYTYQKILEKSPDFQEIINSGRYVYADGRVVRNDPRYVREEDYRLVLTEEASAHVDDCCLRFVRKFVQKGVGKYVLGRMYYDAHLVEQNGFYLRDIINQRQLDDLDAKLAFKDSFPRKFMEAFDQIMEKNNETRESVAYKLHMSARTLKRWLEEPLGNVTPDFIIRVSLLWQIPDWISKMLLERASIHLSEYDRRQRALDYIRTVLWDQGIEEANRYLAEKGLELLETCETDTSEGRVRKRR